MVNVNVGFCAFIITKKETGLEENRKREDVKEREEADENRYFFVDLNNFDEMNKVYEQYFPHKPARSSLDAKRLPMGARMEMDLVALE